MYAGQGCNYFLQSKGMHPPPVVFDMFYFFGRLKEGLTAFFKFTALLVFLDSSLCCRKAGYRYAEGGA